MPDLHARQARKGHECRFLSCLTLCSVLMLIFCLTCPSPGLSQQKNKNSKTSQALTREQGKAKATKQELAKLSEREQALKAETEKFNAKLKTAEEDLKKAEQVLALLDKEEKNLKSEYDRLLKEQAKTSAEMRLLLSKMWEVHIKSNEAAGRADVPDWDQADRELNWTASLYDQVRVKMDLLKSQEAEIEDVLLKHRQLAREAAARLEAANQAKDVILKTRLEHMSKVSELRQEKLTQEAELQRVLKTIDNLNYTLERESLIAEREARKKTSPPPATKTPDKPQAKTPDKTPDKTVPKTPDKTPAAKEPAQTALPANLPSGGSFDKHKGRLPWPVVGTVARKFNPAATPPRRGLGLTAQNASSVRAVFGGRVVHNEVMRGFGRVVIVLHHGNYYSLYAFLAETRVNVGQEVKTGQEIGSTGYYPDLKAPGLYFELRFRQKPINPEQWLAAKK